MSNKQQYCNSTSSRTMNQLRIIARQTAPQVGQQRRRFVDGLVNAKNELKASQEFFQDPAKARLD